MAISVENLEKLVLENTEKYDRTIIISGFFSADVLEDIAKTGKPLSFYYGMYTWSQLTELQYKAFQRLEEDYPNIVINVVTAYHVHTKCYLFMSPSGDNALVGSANCSSAGLLSDSNCEMLVDVCDASQISALKKYASEVDKASVHYDDPAIVTYHRGIAVRKRISTSKGRIYSGNPFVDNIPMYVHKNGEKLVLPKSGINWGLQGGHSSKSEYAEAYIPIKEFDLKYHAAMLPPCGALGTGKGGKATRRLSPVTVTWDDGAVMQMLFQATQEYPVKRRRKDNEPFLVYPKQLTTSSGGAELGKYLRERMGVPGRKCLTIKDFKTYGRDYITLTYINQGNYEADFSPLK